MMAKSSHYDQFPKYFPFTFLRPICFVLEGFRATSEAFWGLDGAFTQLFQINSKYSHKKALLRQKAFQAIKKVLVMSPVGWESHITASEASLGTSSPS